MPKKNRWLLFTAITGLGALTTPCGAETEEARAAPSEAVTPVRMTCSVSKDVLGKIGIQRQLVLNLSMGKGSNLKSMEETMGVPEPALFRQLATVMDELAEGGVKPSPIFDAPDLVAQDLNKTAELLENALAAREHLTHPSWAELSEFYNQKFFVRHNSAINYYLNEAGCLR
jgi:hypothetical protein